MTQKGPQCADGHVDDNEESSVTKANMPVEQSRVIPCLGFGLSVAVDDDTSSVQGQP